MQNEKTNQRTARVGTAKICNKKIAKRIADFEESLRRVRLNMPGTDPNWGEQQMQAQINADVRTLFNNGFNRFGKRIDPVMAGSAQGFYQNGGPARRTEFISLQRGRDSQTEAFEAFDAVVDYYRAGGK